MRLDQAANEEIGRILNGANNSQDGAIAHLASAAGRAAESLVYLAKIDDLRFKDLWPDDEFHNDVVDDSHVHWAAAGALTSLDLCIAAAARLGGFAHRGHGEDDIRAYYSVNVSSGKVTDKRGLVKSPWRAWIDGVVDDKRYKTLLRVRNALVHADAFRIIHATTDPLVGHSLRYGYKIGPLIQPMQPSSHLTITAREFIELARDISLDHVSAFVTVLKTIPR
ncbi:hypothetical protein [Janthinobacterium fluminis]|uniref:Uncharacterized protein n=1 Tax=Janthinobacterium fluminis TaxID=2987524 RepID=A0ABT5JWT9_9BURK|nr:hypothetical protein [Janthinobacterium fluminis]MDC8757203.1 hypothetical protein [Janthinobacterium fluminis]